MIAAIDVETATTTAGSICAIGVAILGPGRAITTKSWLVRPPGNRYLAHLSNIHGLDAADTRDEAPFEDVWPSVLRALSGAEAVFAHNASFERRALEAALARAGLHVPRWSLACTLAAARERLPRLASHRLPHVANYFGLELDHHDAESDAHACALVARRLALRADGSGFTRPWSG